MRGRVVEDPSRPSPIHAEPFGGRSKLEPRLTQTRVCREHVYLERQGDLAHRDLIYVVHDEDGATFERNLIEGSDHEPPHLPELRGPLGVRRRVLELELRVRGRVRRLAPVTASLSGCDAKDDRENPRA
jgi:hypothetical protein